MIQVEDYAKTMTELSNQTHTYQTFFGLGIVPLFVHWPRIFQVTVMGGASTWKKLSPHTAKNYTPEEF